MVVFNGLFCTSFQCDFKVLDHRVCMPHTRSRIFKNTISILKLEVSSDLVRVGTRDLPFTKPAPNEVPQWYQCCFGFFCQFALLKHMSFIERENATTKPGLKHKPSKY